MGWAKFDDGYDDNPKCRAAGKDGRALDQVAIRYCAKYLTDGLVPDHDLAVLAAKADVKVRGTVRRLVEVGRWHGPGHDCPHERCVPCPPGHHVVHDYLEYNPEGEPERERKRRISEERSKAGAKGAARRWENHRAKQTPLPAMANAMATPMANAMANTPISHGKPIAPSPVTPLDTFSGHSRRPTGGPDDRPPAQPDPAAPQQPPEQDELNALVDATLDVLGERDLAGRQAVPGLEPIGRPASWRAHTVRQRRSRGDGDALAALARTHPDDDPEQLATRFESTPNPPLAPARGEPQRPPEPRRLTPDGVLFTPGIGPCPEGNCPDPDPDPTTRATGLAQARGALRPLAETA